MPSPTHQQRLHFQRVRADPLVAAAVHGGSQQHAAGPLRIQAHGGVVGALAQAGGWGQGAQLWGSVRLLPHSCGEPPCSAWRAVPCSLRARRSPRHAGPVRPTCECMHISAASPRPPLGLASHRLSSPLLEDTSQPAGGEGAVKGGHRGWAEGSQPGWLSWQQQGAPGAWPWHAWLVRQARPARAGAPTQNAAAQLLLPQGAAAQSHHPTCVALAARQPRHLRQVGLQQQRQGSGRQMRDQKAGR